jgi:DtxR family Mn-dependent transcriptional regulator
VEDYVKTIYKLTESSADSVTPGELSGRLGVTASSVSGMIRKLDDAGLVEHPRYGDVALTDSGRRLALDVVRRHRLIELYLVRALGYSWDEVHEEAEVLEHVVSERLLARIADALDHPTHDPHGDPIPDSEGKIVARETQTLAELPVGESGWVARVSDEDSELLVYLAACGIGLGARVHVLDRGPFDGPTVVAVEADGVRGEHSFGARVTQAVLIEQGAAASGELAERAR